MESIKEENIEFVIQGCIQKKERFREILYKKFFGYALSVAMIYNRERNDALEVVNDSFVKVFSGIGRYDPSRPFQVWLRKIVINASIDHLRRNKKHYFVEAEKLAIQDETPNVMAQLAAQDVIRLLGLLPHYHRTVFCLYEIDGFTHEEIANKLSIPVSSSRVYLTRAKQRLRELFPDNFE